MCKFKDSLISERGFWFGVKIVIGFPLSVLFMFIVELSEDQPNVDVYQFVIRGGLSTLISVVMGEIIGEIAAYAVIYIAELIENGYNKIPVLKGN